MDRQGARHRFANAGVAVLATINPEGHPHLVPCCFVLHADTVYSAVDTAKPKSTLDLRRVSNVRANPAVSVLAHRYAEDWATLWWVRVDGRAGVVEAEDEREKAVMLLAAKYAQYRSNPPPGDVIAVDVERWRSWPK